MLAQISDAKEYTMKHLSKTFQFDVRKFYTSLGSCNVTNAEDQLHVFEETIGQCRAALKNEQSRRILQNQIQHLAEKKRVKRERKEAFKGPLQYLLRPLLGKNEFAVTQHMYAFIGPNLDNIH